MKLINKPTKKELKEVILKKEQEVKDNKLIYKNDSNERFSK